VHPHALSGLATLLRRASRHAEAAEAWQEIIDMSTKAGGRRPPSPIERQAAEALAIHHEHRARDLGTARRYAETLREQATGRAAEALDHRLGRIDRKMKQQGPSRAFGWEPGA
jgi:hypothetical protein